MPVKRRRPKLRRSTAPSLDALVFLLSTGRDFLGDVADPLGLDRVHDTEKLRDIARRAWPKVAAEFLERIAREEPHRDRPPFAVRAWGIPPDVPRYLADAWLDFPPDDR